uniref:Cytochrome P450 49a1 n=2 Tax=Hirondellea gigas TaxID=1518452 RepID=A0A6A7FWF6_9CRUS
MMSQYGPLVRLSVPGAPVVVATSNADHVRQVMTATLHDPRRHFFLSLKKVRDETPGNYFQGRAGLLPENGAEWWRVRSRVQAPLLQPRSVSRYLPMVDQVAVTFMDRLEGCLSADRQVPDDFLGELYKWALECVGLVALDRSLGCLGPSLPSDHPSVSMIHHINEIFGAVNDTEHGMHSWQHHNKSKAYQRLEHSHNAFLKLAAKCIDESRASLATGKRPVHGTVPTGNSSCTVSGRAGHDGRTVMQTLLETDGLSTSDVATILLDMLIAGVDTTAHCAAFTLYLLARNPSKQRKLQMLIDQELGNQEDGGSLTTENLTRLPYITHILKESLRLFPITTGTNRLLTEDLELSGYRIPAGTLVFGCMTQMSRDERYFRDASQFIPERWERSRPHGPIHPYASLPFSHGKRMCIGKRIAEQEIYTLLVRVLQRYDVTFNSTEEMKVQTQVVLKPDIRLAFKFTHRK